jgi:hypothetical protein
MALQKLSPTPSTSSPAPTPVATPAVSTASTAQKSADTYLKIRLGDTSVPETWFKLVSIDEQTGIHRFEQTTTNPKKYVAFSHPRSPMIAIYPSDKAQNYYSQEPGGRDEGLVARMYCNKTKPTPEKPNPRFYLSGKFHADGLVNFGPDLTGGIAPRTQTVKSDAVVVYGSAVGALSATLQNGLYTLSLQAHERSKAYQAAQDQKKEAVAQPGVSKEAANALGIGGDMDFSM